MVEKLATGRIRRVKQPLSHYLILKVGSDHTGLNMGDQIFLIDLDDPVGSYG